MTAISFIAGVLIGGLLMVIFRAYGQLKLEQGYAEMGIAKINMKYYKITPIDASSLYDIPICNEIMNEAERRVKESKYE